MARINPYHYINGKCEEVFKFYEGVLYSAAS